ncbi:hypothetical protein [Actinomadura napierensis]|uniref:DUF58 domain-containing protein n=1 Tax=Actinomadura napierensis TaxID=267854 RepID=A0ABN3AFM2_9ACTN
MTFPSPAPPYTVRERSSRWLLELPVGVAFGVAWYLFATRVVHGSPFFGLLALAVVGYAVFRVLRPVPSLRAGPDGFRLGEVSVPWRSIREVVLVLPAVQTEPCPAVEVGLRLHHGAPLPDGMDAVVYEPGDSDAMHLRRSFRPGRVDPRALAAAVGAYGRVAVIESRAGTEHRIA